MEEARDKEDRSRPSLELEMSTIGRWIVAFVFTLKRRGGTTGDLVV